MKKFLLFGAQKAFLALLLFSIPTISTNLRSTSDSYNADSLNGKGSYSGDQNNVIPQEDAKEEVGEELYPAGSSLPDCSHACGPCFPCKRVIVGYKCSMTEPCPIVYRCMCKGRYYHVPSN